jgi:hypothetical protein
LGILQAYDPNKFLEMFFFFFKPKNGNSGNLSFFSVNLTNFLGHLQYHLFL